MYRLRPLRPQVPGSVMKGDPEQRALLLGEYIVEHGATVRAAARAFGCSKSTDIIYLTQTIFQKKSIIIGYLSKNLPIFDKHHPIKQLQTVFPVCNKNSRCIRIKFPNIIHNLFFRIDVAVIVWNICAVIF